MRTYVGECFLFRGKKFSKHDAINKLTCEDAIALAKYGSQARFWLWAPARYKTASKHQTTLTFYGYTESIRITFPAIVTFIIAKALAEGKIPIVTGTFSVI